MKEILDAVAPNLAAAPFGILLILKSATILAAGILAALTLRNRSASVRHAVLALTLAMSLALPLGMIVSPALRVVVSPGLSVPPSEVTTVTATGSTTAIAQPDTRTSEVSESPAAPVQRGAVDSPSRSLILGIQSVPPQSLIVLWLVGALLVVARMAAGRISLAKVARKSTTLGDSTWRSLLERESHLLGVTRSVRLLRSASVSTPLTYGTRNPIIILPDEAADWSPAHREVVLRHELAHISSGDAFISLVAGFSCAVYWFNPLAWIASRRLRTEQERACDDRVIALGTPAPEYASHLLEVARAARDLGMHGFVSVAMARPSQLEGRLLSVLNDRDRTDLTRSKRVTSAAMALVLLTVISALQPVVAESAIVVSSQSTSASVLPVVVTPSRVQYEAADSIVTGDVSAISGGTLLLELETGAGVTITGTNENRVRVRAILGGRDWRNTRVSIRNTDDARVRVHTEYDRTSGSQSSSHRLEISVPRRFNVRIKSAGGSLTIRDVEGDFTGSTGGGEIWIERARGSARLSTGGGPVDVTNSTLSGSVSTGGGSVLIQRVSGGLTGHSGTGDVLYGTADVTFSEPSRDGVRRASDGRLYIRKSGGGVNLAEAPDGASISTGGGPIRIGASGGQVSATTGGGDITIGPVRGSAEVSTGAGDVTITASGMGGRSIKATSGNGTIMLTLPRDFSGSLDLETAYTNNLRSRTRIESDWPVTPTETKDWDSTNGTPRRYVRARQSVGEGSSSVTVKTINGNIIIRRAR